MDGYWKATLGVGEGISQETGNTGFIEVNRLILNFCGKILIKMTEMSFYVIFCNFFRGLLLQLSILHGFQNSVVFTVL